MIYLLIPVASFAFGWLCGRLHQLRLDAAAAGDFGAKVERQRKTVTPFTERQHINFPNRTFLRERLQVVRANKR